ncbi:uncharacterized protein LOC126878873 [Diabrotica virgifera virgifera]|uniref:RNA-directed DNA polymerase from mobile element jockey-like n=2 Tax=Diabrotica virgifera virgifera TaxID=50390 RepID=A0ABM5JIG2_DIAVI|nr:uncharacterized protein LOC126878873 [Diabrotica virgifera virgifera]XP_050497729.1 uncharacterized protein LOC126878873 [Diabrotica virgifera virgifera]XP_050497730.1 uncharacterized protein LOC126878873 [Diabrotica virgifera virgifera]
MYADDSSVIVSAHTYVELQNRVSRVIRLFQTWCTQNLLQLNIDKTSYIHFRCKRNMPVVSIPEIVNIPNIKFLGVFLDQFMSWDVHVEYVNKKLNCSFYALVQLKRTLSIKTLINVYYSLVYCHLTYNVTLWGNSTKSDTVFIKQKRIIRLIFNIPFGHTCKQVFINNNILPLPSIYILKSILYIKHNLHSFKRNSDLHAYSTRNANQFVTVGHKLSKFEKSTDYVGVRLYNHLPNEVRSLHPVKFKRVVKSILCKHAFYSVEEYLATRLLL